MENNEIMNFENIEVMDDAVVAEGGSGMSTGVAMLVGAGATFAIGAVVKLVKKGIADHKAKKELKQPDKVILVEDEDLAEVVE